MCYLVLSVSQILQATVFFNSTKGSSSMPTNPSSTEKNLDEARRDLIDQAQKESPGINDVLAILGEYNEIERSQRVITQMLSPQITFTTTSSSE